MLIKMLIKVVNKLRNLMLIVEYDGTCYHGWQRQQNAVTVQEVLEKALQVIMKEDIAVTGCSRTDAGVHARGFVCNFFTHTNIPADRVPYALNSVLPDDVVILSCHHMQEDFHARYHARSKKYRYRIINRTFPSPFEKHYACHFPYALDVDKMIKATKFLEGQHDFRAFMATGSMVKDTVRNIFEVSITQNNAEIRIDITGDGFLYNMVRIIAGTLIYVGIGKIGVSDISEIIACKDRKKAGITAPPQGLYLMEVRYGDE